MSGTKRLTIAVLGCSGVFSGILTLHPPVPRDFLPGIDVYVGAIFGIILSANLWIFYSPRSIGRSMGVTISSTVAYIAAMFSTIGTNMLLPRLLDDNRSGNPPSYVMFVGGVVGASIISAAVLLLYRDENTRLAKRILICTLGGGVLGVVGYSLGFLFASQDSSQHGDLPGIVPLYVVWQAGMGCLLATVLPEPIRSAASEPFREISILQSTERFPPRKARKISLPGRLFISTVAISLLLYIARITWFQYNFSRQKEEFVQFQISRPSLQNLPAIEPMAAQDAVLLHPIAGRTAQLSISGPLSNKATTSKPAFVTFYACYVHLPNERCEDSPPDVRVQISQWPNSAWSSHEMEGIHYGFGAGYFNHAKKIQKFGNLVMVDATPKEPGKGKSYWTSGTVLIEIDSNISDPDEFIREYLERYPSSL